MYYQYPKKYFFPVVAKNDFDFVEAGYKDEEVFKSIGRVELHVADSIEERLGDLIPDNIGSFEIKSNTDDIDKVLEETKFLDSNSFTRNINIEDSNINEFKEENLDETSNTNVPVVKEDVERVEVDKIEDSSSNEGIENEVKTELEVEVIEANITEDTREEDYEVVEEEKTDIEEINEEDKIIEE